MILTITLNPSVDISYPLDHLSLDTVNRVSNVSKTAGGKGLNVSRVLKQLEEDVRASGFLGGSLGDFIRTGLSDRGIRDYFVDIQGNTRNCIAILHDGNKQTEVLESGPVISDVEAETFLSRFSQFASEASVITVSGSLPKGIADDYYSQLIRIANEQGVPVLLDTKGSLLQQTLRMSSKPTLIKPNEEEFSELTGGDQSREADLIAALLSGQLSEIPWVVVTTGSSGAIIKHKERAYRVTIPHVEAVNPVGSGDATLAGFASGLSRGYNGADLIRYSMAMGVLNAMEAETGVINTTNLQWCMDEMDVSPVDIQ